VGVARGGPQLLPNTWSLQSILRGRHDAVAHGAPERLW